MSDRTDILILGPYPPPAGGVSVHIFRLSRLLQSAGYGVGVLNYYGHVPSDPVVCGTLKRNPLRYWLATRTATAQVVHYHHSRFACLVAVALARRASPAATFIVTVHGQVLDKYLRAPLLGRLARWSLRRFDKIVCVAPEIATTLAGHVADVNLIVQPAFIPASVTERGRELPADLASFLRVRGPVAVVSAHAISPLHQGDLHGLDVVTNVFSQLAIREPGARLVIFLASAPRGRRRRRYFGNLVRQLEHAGIADRVRVCTGIPLWPIFDNATNVVYLRPTRTEGDAVSVREALMAGIPVIASDVATRPKGVRVVPLTDELGWLEAILRAFEGQRVEPPERPVSIDANVVASHLELYKAS